MSKLLIQEKTGSAKQTCLVGKQLGRSLRGGDLVLLFGELAAGKTELTRGIAAGLGIKENIKSPTFAFVREYILNSGGRFYHYDLYRLDAGADLEFLNLEEILADPKNIVALEWPDRLMGGLSAGRTISVKIQTMRGDRRKITIQEC